jgi:TolA-binding protein
VTRTTWKLPIAIIAIIAATGFFVPESRADTSFFERRNFAFAKRAFQDSLYDVAKIKLEKFLEKYPESDLETEARWLLGQSQFFLGEFDPALKQFQNPPAREADSGASFFPGFLFWEGQCLAATERLPEAESVFRNFLKEFPEHELRAQVQIALSKVLFRKEQPEEALRTLDPLLNDQEPSKDAQLARLQKARIEIGIGKLDEALTSLQRLSEKTEKGLEGELIYEAALLQGKILSQKESWDEALQCFQKITGDSLARPRHRIVEAWYQSGKVQTGRQEWKLASEAFENAFRLALDSSRIQEAVLAYLDAQFRNKTLTKGALEVRNFVNKNPQTAVSGLYAIGRYFFLEKKYDAAITELDHLTKNYPDSRWVWPARLTIAESLLLQGQEESGRELLVELSQNADDSSVKIRALTLLGECAYEGQDYTRAAELFREASELPSAQSGETETLLARSLFAFARAGQMEPFVETEKRFLEAFPKSAYRVDILMEKADLFEESGKNEQARKLYSQLAQQEFNPTQTAEALYRLGMTSFEIGDLNEALTAFTALEKNHPEFPRLDHAVFRKIQSQQILGSHSSEDLQQSLIAWLETFPNSLLKGRVHNTIGNLLENRGLYAEAVTQYRTVIESAPSSQEADQAAFWGGKCLFQLKQHEDAIAMLEKVRDESPWKPNARLTQILCTMHMGDYAAALKIAEAVLKSDPAAEIESFARLRQAECLFTLSSEDRSLYPAALTAVNHVVEMESATSAERNEAGFIKGEILQKMNRSNEALEAFLDVVYAQFLPEETTGLASQPEVHWFIKSGLAAARIKEGQGDIRGAVEIYRILERIGEPNRREFRRKIEDLKNEYFIYETS